MDDETKNNKSPAKTPPSIKKKSEWNDKIEKCLKIIEKQSKLYKKMHMEIAQDSNTKYSIYSLTSIILSPISGIISVVGTMVSSSLDDLYFYTVSSTIISFVTGIILAINKFNNYEQLTTSHKIASSRYDSLEQNVRRQLSIYRTDRISADEYFDYICKSFEDLNNSSPMIPTGKKIIDTYSKAIELLENEYEYENENENKKLQYVDADLEKGKTCEFLLKQDLKRYDDNIMHYELKKTKKNMI